MQTPGAEQRVAVIEDAPEVREGLVWLLEGAGFEVEGFPSTEAFLARLGEERFACIVADVCLPGRSGVELRELLRARGVDLPVILLSGQADSEMVIQALRAGVADFFEKPFAPEELTERIRSLLAARKKKEGMETVEEAAARFRELTPREREVCRLLLEGLPTKEIARRLGISPRTAEKHRARVFAKAGVRNAAELVRRVYTRPHGSPGEEISPSSPSAASPKQSPD